MSLPIGVRGSLTNYEPIGSFSSKGLSFPGGSKFVVSFFEEGTTTVIPKSVSSNSLYQMIQMQTSGEISYGGNYLR